MNAASLRWLLRRDTTRDLFCVFQVDLFVLVVQFVWRLRVERLVDFSHVVSNTGCPEPIELPRVSGKVKESRKGSPDGQRRVRKQLASKGGPWGNRVKASHPATRPSRSNTASIQKLPIRQLSSRSPSSTLVPPLNFSGVIQPAFATRLCNDA